jgi:formylmethanofuran dehydrogenase subunit D
MGAMSEGRFILIAGRTSQQGCGISEGKDSEGYRATTTVLQMSPEDLSAIGLTSGDRVRVTSRTGEVDLPITAAKAGELPPGVLFIAYGDCSSRLMGGDTHGSGMPTSKGIDVRVEKLVEKLS